MTVQEAPKQIQITLPEPLYRWLTQEAQRHAQDVSAIVQAALERYAHGFDLTQTKTGELCGSLVVTEPEPGYVTGMDEEGNPITNYAEHVDSVLYEAP